MKKCIGLLAIASGLVPTFGHANTIDYTTLESLFGEPVTTGATGIAQRASEVPLNMEIITSDDIKRSAARDIPEILRQVSGVNVQRSGSTSADVNIRGLNEALSQRLLVLLNGRDVYQNHYGYVDWASIPVQLSEIKQIEVIKGPNTALYGFNATSGVINIITFNPLYDDVSNVRATYGNHDHSELSVVKTFQSENVGFRVSGNLFHTDEANGPYIDSAELSLREDNSASKNLKIDGVVRAGENTHLGFEATRSYNHSNTYSFFNVITDIKHDLHSYKAQLSSSTNLGVIEATIYHNASQVNYDYPVANTFVIPVDINTENTVAQISNTYTLDTNHTFRMTGEYRHNTSNIFTFDTDPNGLSDFRFDNIALSGLWNWKATNKLSLSTALRYDRTKLDRDGGASPIFSNAEYDRQRISEISANIGLNYTLSDEDSIRLSYARGIDLPTIAEFAMLFPFGTGQFFVGNPNLNVSTVDNIEANYQRYIAPLDANFKASIFYHRVKGIHSIDDFTLDFPTPSTTIYQNALDTNVYGGEIELTGKFADNFHYGASYALAITKDDFLDTNNNGSITDEDPLQKYEGLNPEHQVNLNIGYKKDKLTIDGFVNYISSSVHDRRNVDVKIDDNLILSTKINYDWNEKLSTSLTGIGVLESNWQENAGLRAERQVFLTVDYKF